MQYVPPSKVFAAMQVKSTSMLKYTMYIHCTTVFTTLMSHVRWARSMAPHMTDEPKGQPIREACIKTLLFHLGPRHLVGRRESDCPPGLRWTILIKKESCGGIEFKYFASLG
jgi:hypothetical protein